MSIRFRNYFSKGYLEKPRLGKTAINKALLKYGYANFQLDIIEYVSKEKAIEIEQYYMDLLNPQYNLLKVAGSWLGYKHSEETKLKMSESRRGKIMTDETKLKMSESQRGEKNPMYGKANKTFLGRTHNEQSRRKMRDSHLGEKHYFFGKSHSEETKSKISNKLGSPVQVTDLETNKVIYDTANKAAQSLLCSTSTVNSYRSKNIYKNKYLIVSVTRNLSIITCRQGGSWYLPPTPDNKKIVRGKGSPLSMIISNGGIRPNQEGRVASLVKILMIKAILLEVYLPVVSSHGLQLTCDPPRYAPGGEGVWNRLSAAISHLELLGGGTVRPQTNCINNFKVKSRQSKGILIQNIGTSRLPKAGNGYGNRGIVVPGYANIYCPMKIGTRGRIPDFNIRELSTSAGSPVQSKSDTCAKLLKLREHCMKNPDTPVNLEKIYRLMYDPSLYELAYNKLKSNPGNMTAGITPTTLDGMSMEVIERIIEKLKDNSFKFTPGRRVEIPKASGGTRPLTIAPPN